MKLIYKLFDEVESKRSLVTKTKLKVCVIDNIGGCYFPIADNLTKYFDIYYHTVVQNPFPRMSTMSIGLGTDVKILKDFWSNIDQFELFIFPDLYFKDWGTHLRKMGKNVWGGCGSEDLETNRKLFKQELSNVGLSVAPTKYFMGIDNLVKYLKTNEDKWIKISFFRGEMETFHHVNWRQSEIWSNDIRIKLGPLASTLEFITEDGINSIAEIGSDGWLVNGNNANSFLWGIEVKDCGYIGKAELFNKMPQPIQDVFNKFRSITQKYNHTGFYSTEIRVGEDGNDYYTDPCMRAGSPPSNVYMEMISNWDEILLEGSKGNVIEPKFKAKYGVEIIIKSAYCQSNFLPIGFDSKYKDNIKLKGSLILDGKNYIIPFDQAGIDEMDAFGSVVVVGNDIDIIVNQALEIANELEVYGLIFNENALDKAKESLMKIEEALNVKF